MAYTDLYARKKGKKLYDYWTILQRTIH
jgi:hypothetical protein